MIDSENTNGTVGLDRSNSQNLSKPVGHCARSTSVDQADSSEKITRGQRLPGVDEVCVITERQTVSECGSEGTSGNSAQNFIHPI